MCGRYTLTADPEALQTEFKLDSVIQNLPPRYNIAPTQDVAVVLNEDGLRVLDAFHWGLIPFWAKDSKIGSRMINARSETLAQKPSFKRPLQKQRCLIPADGFYEWENTPNGKQPWYIHLVDHRPFAFAGLWDYRQAPNGEEIYSCTIITTEPNPLVAAIHNRMPVILPPSAFDQWLDPVEKNPNVLLSLLTPWPAEKTRGYPVSKLVNSPANDHPDCIVPL